MEEEGKRCRGAGGAANADADADADELLRLALLLDLWQNVPPRQLLDTLATTQQHGGAFSERAQAALAAAVEGDPFLLPLSPPAASATPLTEGRAAHAARVLEALMSAALRAGAVLDDGVAALYARCTMRAAAEAEAEAASGSGGGAVPGAVAWVTRAYYYTSRPSLDEATRLAREVERVGGGGLAASDNSNAGRTPPPPPPQPPVPGLLLLRASPDFLAGNTGCSLWAAGLVLAQLLLSNPALVAGAKLVLDVGTGTGAVGLAAARAGAKRVLLSDCSAPALANAVANARLNGLCVVAGGDDVDGDAAGGDGGAALDVVAAAAALRGVRDGGVAACRLSWEDDAEAAAAAAPDVIVGADILYDPSTFSALARLLRLLLERGRHAAGDANVATPLPPQPPPVAYIATALRSRETFACFEDAAARNNLELHDLEDDGEAGRRHDDDQQHGVLLRFQGVRLGIRGGAIVVASGGGGDDARVVVHRVSLAPRGCGNSK